MIFGKAFPAQLLAFTMLTAGAAFAQDAAPTAKPDGARMEHRKEMHEKFKNASPEEREQMKANRQEHREERREKMKERFENASPEEREKMKAHREERREERHEKMKERMENASPEQREKMKAHMQERREGRQERRGGGESGPQGMQGGKRPHGMPGGAQGGGPRPAAGGAH